MTSLAAVGHGKRRVPLSDRETVIAEHSCYKYIMSSLFVASGTIFVTSKRLIWTPSLFSPLAAATIIERSSIRKIERNYGGLLAGRFLNSWRVELPEEYFTFNFGIFLSKDHLHWLDEIKQWANV